MPRHKRIRVRGKPRIDIDVDLLAQALIMASQDMREVGRPAETTAVTRSDEEGGDGPGAGALPPETTGEPADGR